MLFDLLILSAQYKCPRSILPLWVGLAAGANASPEPGQPRAASSAGAHGGKRLPGSATGRLSQGGPQPAGAACSWVQHEPESSPCYKCACAWQGTLDQLAVLSHWAPSPFSQGALEPCFSPTLTFFQLYRKTVVSVIAPLLSLTTNLNPSNTMCHLADRASRISIYPLPKTLSSSLPSVVLESPAFAAHRCCSWFQPYSTKLRSVSSLHIRSLKARGCMARCISKYCWHL